MPGGASPRRRRATGRQRRRERQRRPRGQPEQRPGGERERRGGDVGAGGGVAADAARHDSRRGLGGAIDRGYFVGVDKGFYEEQGISVEVDNFRSAADMVPLLATGRMDVGHGSTNPGFYNALSSGIPVKIVTDVTLTRAPQSGIRNSMWLLVRKDLIDSGQVHGVADLRGRRVAINGTGNLNHLQLKEVLAYNGLGLDDVDVTQVLFPDQMSALGNGAIEGRHYGRPVHHAGRVARYRAADLRHRAGHARPPGAAVVLRPRVHPDPVGRGQAVHGRLHEGAPLMEDAFTRGVNREEAIQIFINNTPLKGARCTTRWASRTARRTAA